MTQPPIRTPRPTPNPWVAEFGDYRGLVIRITVDWNPVAETSGKHLVTAITVYRDTACQFRNILIGTSLDGNPDDTDKTVSVPAGETQLSAAVITALRNRGVGTIEDILTFQITAGR